MSRFASTDTVRYDLGGDDWVEIRRFTYGDRQAITAAGMQVRSEFDRRGRSAGVHTSFDTAAANLETLKRAVAAWGGPGFCREHDHDGGDAPAYNGTCSAMSVSAETLDALDLATGERIAQLINETNPQAAGGDEEGEPHP